MRDSKRMQYRRYQRYKCTARGNQQPKQSSTGWLLSPEANPHGTTEAGKLEGVHLLSKKKRQGLAGSDVGQAVGEAAVQVGKGVGERVAG